MSIQWSGLGPELLLRLDRSSREPLGSQLERELRQAIRSGRVVAEERLPSTRSLARELGVSRGVVQECYAQLLAEGYLVARTGSATRVASGAAERSTEARTGPARFGAAVPAGSTLWSPRLRIDFRPGWPDVASFPRSDWIWAMREVSRTAPADAFGYGDPRGNERLRHVLAGYLRRVRGAVVDPELILICAGFAQGFNLVARVLAQEGVDAFALEDPGDPGDAATVAHWGLRPVPVPVDEDGVDARALASSASRGAVLTPAHQSPTGVVLAPPRRQAIVDWAMGCGATVIEDDYDSEFRYDREPVGVLQGLAPSRIALIGTTSKSLSPALRLGWIVCPPALLDAVTGEKHRDDRGSPMLEQLALSILIESGRYDRHLRRMRRVYASRRRALIEALAEHAPRVTLHGLAAGIHAVARLPAGVDEQEVAVRARERSVGLYPMSRYRHVQRPGPPALVLGFGNLSEASIIRGIAAVADLLS